MYFRDLRGKMGVTNVLPGIFIKTSRFNVLPGFARENGRFKFFCLLFLNLNETN